MEVLQLQTCEFISTIEVNTNTYDKVGVLCKWVFVLQKLLICFVNLLNQKQQCFGIEA